MYSWDLHDGSSLRVIPTKESKTFALYLMYNVGFHDAGHRTYEIPHLLEHLLADIKVCDNAYTSDDTTVYDMSGRSENLQDTIEKACDMKENFRNRITTESFEREKHAVLAELSDRSHSVLVYNLMYGTSVLPTMKERLAALETITLNAVVEFFTKWYTASNSTWIYAGSENPEKVYRVFRRFSSSSKSGPSALQVLRPVMPLLSSPKVYRIQSNQDIFQLTILWPSQTADNLVDVWLYALLEIMRKRLFSRLRNERMIIYDVPPRLIKINRLWPGAACGLLTWALSRRDINEVLEEILACAQDMVTKGITDEEFTTTQSKMKQYNLRWSQRLDNDPQASISYYTDFIVKNEPFFTPEDEMNVITNGSKHDVQTRASQMFSSAPLIIVYGDFYTERQAPKNALMHAKFAQQGHHEADVHHVPTPGCILRRAK